MVVMLRCVVTSLPSTSLDRSLQRQWALIDPGGTPERIFVLRLHEPAHFRDDEAATRIDARTEYDDGDIPEQTSARVFSCHQQDGSVCAGWLGHRDPLDLLAVRIGIADGRLDPSCAEYSTTVPLWPTGADAARHGSAAITKLEMTRQLRNPDA